MAVFVYRRAARGRCLSTGRRGPVSPVADQRNVTSTVGDMPLNAIVCTLVSLSLSSVASADAVLQWNAAALEAIRAEKVTPPAASRALAMLHAAIYDAVNGITRTRDPFFVRAAARRTPHRKPP